MSAPGVTRGALVLADIGGYTRYLGGVELDHSHDILADLIGEVARPLRSALVLDKVEGDAVFLHGKDTDPDGELLLATLDAAYAAFAARRRTIELRTTCDCAACQQVGSLDLKMVVHHGGFIEHQVAGSREVTGPDVIAAHRLLRNSVARATGVGAYALVSDAAARALALEPAALGMAAHQEDYEDVGSIPGWVRDLGSRWHEQQERSPVLVEAGRGAVVVEADLSADPALVWDVLTDPRQQLRWRAGITDVQQEVGRGARGVGTRAHCVHGKDAFDQEVLDWRPFDYFTYREVGRAGEFLWSFVLTPQRPGATRVSLRARPTGGRVQRALVRLARPVARRALEANRDGLVSMLGSADV